MSADRTYYPFLTYFFKLSAKIDEIIATMFDKIPKKPSILKFLRQGHAHNVIFVELLDLMNVGNDTKIASISHLVPQVGNVKKEKLTFDFQGHPSRSLKLFYFHWILWYQQC